MILKEYFKLYEVSYKKNIGFHELSLFYKKANKKQIDELEKFLDKLDDNKLTKKEWEEFRKLIFNITNILLK